MSEPINIFIELSIELIIEFFDAWNFRTTRVVDVKVLNVQERGRAVCNLLWCEWEERTKHS